MRRGDFEQTLINIPAVCARVKSSEATEREGAAAMWWSPWQATLAIRTVQAINITSEHNTTLVEPQDPDKLRHRKAKG